MDASQIRYTLRQLRYFIVAAETLSFTEAAKQLYVSQPSISAALSSLEQTFSVQLFLRHHGQGLSLTQAGHSVLREARALLQYAEELQSTAQALGTGQTGTIAVGCLITLAPLAVPALMQKFSQVYSGIKLDVIEADQEVLLGRLQDGTLDVALSYDLQVPPEVEFKSLAELPPYVVMPPEHPLAQVSRPSLADLSQHPYVLLDLPLSREYFLSLFAADGLVPRIVCRSASAEFVRGLVANGTGFSILNFPLRNTQALDGKAFVMRRLEGRHRPLSLGIVRARQTQARRVVQTFTEFCTEEIPQLAAWPDP